MPKIIGNRPANRWENEVLKAFKNQLPADWVVMPSINWALQQNGYVRNGEADFVVLAPEWGMVVVEVKGSREFKVAEDGTWYRLQWDGSWIQLSESPPEQATRNMYTLVGTLCERFNWHRFPGRYAFMVIYPQGKVDSLPAMFDESTIATHQHMTQLDSKLRRAIERRAGPSQSDDFSQTVVESIIDHLKDRQFHVQRADTSEVVGSDSGKITELTRQQYASLKGLFDLPSVAVIGPAGSGKTVLAMWRLKALIDAGHHAIYVCFNRALAESLRFLNPDHEKHIWNVDKLFSSLCPDVRRDGDITEFFREQLPGTVFDRANALVSYDAVIIDEGQDFSEEQIIALNELLSDHAFWAFFADWNQDLYSVGKNSPLGVEVIFHLYYNCRNTVRINQTANDYLKSKVESMPGMPEGVSPILTCNRDQASVAWKLAKQWSGSGDVVILSPFTYENSAMSQTMLGHGLQLSFNIEDRGKEGVVYFSTIKSFKGIEAESVIVVDVGIPQDNTAFTKQDVYVACTRAIARLALITREEQVIKYYQQLG